MQLGLYFDQTRCTGCGACLVACKDWHDIPAGPEKWIRLGYIEKGKYPDVFVAYLVSLCYHCLDPVCIPACPPDAITKRDSDGIVIVNQETCIGKDECKSKCLTACPYNAPQFAPEPNAKMRKCNLCLERWQENKMPICVESCPTRALDAGPLEDLKKNYQNTSAAEGFVYSKRVAPAVIFKPKTLVLPAHR
ncbi:4Fe-4S dicluster domain-containing protein [Chloroflexota bacterium]